MDRTEFESGLLHPDSLVEFVMKLIKRDFNGNQAAVARAGKFDANYISRLKSGERIGSFDNMIKLANGLGIRPGVLMDVLAGYDPNQELQKITESAFRKSVFQSVLNYLNAANDTQELQELIEAMGFNKDKRYESTKEVVSDASEGLGEPQKVKKRKGFRTAPDKPKDKTPTPKKEIPKEEKPSE
jgi:transcriptional regulator with XRE-family HTH domain